jgi:hypothetical protein
MMMMMMRGGLAVQLVVILSSWPSFMAVAATADEDPVVAAASEPTMTTKRSSSSSSLVRHRRRVLDVDAFMEQVNPLTATLDDPSNSNRQLKSQGGKKYKSDCGGDDDYLTDLFHCDHDRFSMSMSMPQRPPSILTLWPATPTVPIAGPPASTTLSPVVPFPSRPTIPIVVPAPLPPNVPTTAPYKACRALDRTQAVLNVLRTQDPTLPATTSGPALDWLIFQDPAMIDPCTIGDDSDGDNDSDPTLLLLTQRYALAAFYYATNGPNWTANDMWLSGTSECSWMGVTCDLSGKRGNIVTELALRTYFLYLAGVVVSLLHVSHTFSYLFLVLHHHQTIQQQPKTTWRGVCPTNCPS